MSPAESLDEILSDPGYQALNPGERTGIRRAFHQKTTRDPGFLGLKPEDRQSIAHDILFPASEYPEPEREGRPKPTVGETFSSGFKRAFITSPEAAGPAKTLVGALEMASAPLQPAANLVTRTGERVSDYLTKKGYGRVADVAAGLTTGVGDYATGVGLAKGLKLLRAPLARALPTKTEQVASVQGAGEQRLSDLEKLATEQQAKAVGAQAERLQQIPVARQAARERGAQDIAAVEQQLAEQQRGVGLEAAQAGAPVGPKRMNFEKRYTSLEQAADQIPISPVNLNVKAHGLIREPGLPGTPTLPSERSSAAIARTLTEADPEEIAGQVRRALTSGGEAKAVDYNELTKTVLGPATSEDVTVGELLRARKRLRAAGRAAYASDHKNLGRQWGDLEDAITEDIKGLAKTDPRAATVYRQSKNLDKDYFKKKAADWYAEGVDQAFDPVKGVWDRKRFTKWWEKHADSANNDRDLRRLLGDRYDGTKGLVEDMQKATELNIEQAAKEAARNINRRMGGELRDIRTTEKQLRKLGEKGEKEMQAAQIEKRAAIEADTKKQIEQITGKPYEGSLHRFFGSLGFIGGLGTAGLGAITGNPTLIQAGLKGAGLGAFTLMTHDAFLKLINAPRGLSIARRLVRAAPGTGEAIAASSAAARVAQGIRSEEGDQGIDARPSSAKPKILNPDSTVSTERTIGIEADGKHYLIPTIINGKQVSPDEAIKQWRAGTNKPVGVYGSQQEADTQAKARTERLSREMQPPTSGAKESFLKKYGIE